jgi:hypothetical protein
MEIWLNQDHYQVKWLRKRAAILITILPIYHKTLLIYKKMSLVKIYKLKISNNNSITKIKYNKTK